MGEGKVSEDVLFHPLCRRKPGIIKNGNDIFQGAHHVLQSGADEFFFRTEIVPHGGDIHICFFRDGPHGGCLESFFTEDAGGYGDHFFFHLLTFAGEFFLSHNTFPFLALIVFLIKGRVFS